MSKTPTRPFKKSGELVPPPLPPSVPHHHPDPTQAEAAAFKGVAASSPPRHPKRKHGKDASSSPAMGNDYYEGADDGEAQEVAVEEAAAARGNHYDDEEDIVVQDTDALLLSLHGSAAQDDAATATATIQFDKADDEVVAEAAATEEDIFVPSIPSAKGTVNEAVASREDTTTADATTTSLHYVTRNCSGCNAPLGCDVFTCPHPDHLSCKSFEYCSFACGGTYHTCPPPIQSVESNQYNDTGKVIWDEPSKSNYQALKAKAGCLYAWKPNISAAEKLILDTAIRNGNEMSTTLAMTNLFRVGRTTQMNRRISTTKSTLPVKDILLKTVPVANNIDRLEVYWLFVFHEKGLHAEGLTTDHFHFQEDHVVEFVDKTIEYNETGKLVVYVDENKSFDIDTFAASGEFFTWWLTHGNAYRGMKRPLGMPNKRSSGMPNPAIGDAEPIVPDEWKQNLQAVLKYKEDNGKELPQGITIGAWLCSQRKTLKKMKSDHPNYSRVSIFEQHGISLDPQEDEWEQNFKAVLKYKEDNGKWPSQGITIGEWLSSQRMALKKMKSNNPNYSRVGIFEQHGIPLIVRKRKSKRKSKRKAAPKKKTVTKKKRCHSSSLVIVVCTFCSNTFVIHSCLFFRHPRRRPQTRRRQLPRKNSSGRVKLEM